MRESRRDVAEYWAHPVVSDVDLMRARFVRHAFTRHSHETFTVGVTLSGVEELRVGSATHRVGGGRLVLLNPDDVHTGAPANDDGWAYRVLYAAEDVVREAAGATPWFPVPVVDDPASAALLLHAHLAAGADACTSSVTLFRALALIAARHGERSTVECSAGPSAAARARELLHDRLDDPPGLDELAATVGSGKFALLRAFRARYGMPPHAYLTVVRVRRACALLDAGHAVADVAAQVGFCDQPHLTRQFRRIVGVPPGAYRRKNVQAGG